MGLFLQFCSCFLKFPCLHPQLIGGGEQFIPDIAYIIGHGPYILGHFYLDLVHLALRSLDLVHLDACLVSQEALFELGLELTLVETIIKLLIL